MTSLIVGSNSDAWDGQTLTDAVYDLVNSGVEQQSIGIAVFRSKLCMTSLIVGSNSQCQQVLGLVPGCV